MACSRFAKNGPFHAVLVTSLGEHLLQQPVLALYRVGSETYSPPPEQQPYVVDPVVAGWAYALLIQRLGWCFGPRSIAAQELTVSRLYPEWSNSQGQKVLRSVTVEFSDGSVTDVVQNCIPSCNSQHCVEARQREGILEFFEYILRAPLDPLAIRRASNLRARQAMLLANAGNVLLDWGLQSGMSHPAADGIGSPLASIVVTASGANPTTYTPRFFASTARLSSSSVLTDISTEPASASNHLHTFEFNLVHQYCLLSAALPSVSATWSRSDYTLMRNEGARVAGNYANLVLDCRFAPNVDIATANPGDILNKSSTSTLAVLTAYLLQDAPTVVEGQYAKGVKYHPNNGFPFPAAALCSGAILSENLWLDHEGLQQARDFALSTSLKIGTPLSGEDVLGVLSIILENLSHVSVDLSPVLQAITDLGSSSSTDLSWLKDGQRAALLAIASTMIPPDKWKSFSDRVNDLRLVLQKTYPSLGELDLFGEEVDS